MAQLAPLEGVKGKESVAVVVYEAGMIAPPLPVPPEGARVAHTEAVSLATLRAAGDPCAVTNPLTGKSHRIALAPYVHLDGTTTRVEVIFHFVPVPPKSKEAQGMRERAAEQLRQQYENVLAVFDAPHGMAGECRHVPPHRQGAKGEMLQRARGALSANISFCTSIALVTHGEVASINEEFAAQRPDVFSSWGR